MNKLLLLLVGSLTALSCHSATPVPFGELKTEDLSLLSFVTMVPVVLKCTYKWETVEWTERQLGVECDRRRPVPKKYYIN